MIEHGINRIKHASDCAAVLTKEIKMHANAGRCKALVLVDRINTFFEEEFSYLSYPDRSKVRIDEITIARAFKKLLYGDWVNNAIIKRGYDLFNKFYFNRKMVQSLALLIRNVFIHLEYYLQLRKRKDHILFHIKVI